jgi:hypothetical protein
VWSSERTSLLSSCASSIEIKTFCLRAAASSLMTDRHSVRRLVVLSHFILLCDLSTKRKNYPSRICVLRFTNFYPSQKSISALKFVRTSTTEQPVMRGYDLGHTLKLLIRSLVKVATHYTRRRAKEDFTPNSSQG